MSKKAIIISATSDIAVAVCEKWNQNGYEIYGTYRNKNENYFKLIELGVHLFECDMSEQKSVENACYSILTACSYWDVIIFATGTPAPVGSFKEIDMAQWLSSVQINFTHQILATHIFLRKANNTNETPSIIYFAGGGTNNAVINYSAYTISKIALIKMSELLDAEIENIKFSIIGPGWVKTKTHNVTIEAGPKLAGKNYFKTLQKLSSLSASEFTPMSEVIQSIDWVVKQPKSVVGGRNFSTVTDCFDDNLIKCLLEEQSMYKLRRHGNYNLTKG